MWPRQRRLSSTRPQEEKRTRHTARDLRCRVTRTLSSARMWWKTLRMNALDSAEAPRTTNEQSQVAERTKIEASNINQEVSHVLNAKEWKVTIEKTNRLKEQTSQLRNVRAQAKESAVKIQQHHWSESKCDFHGPWVRVALPQQRKKRGWGNQRLGRPEAAEHAGTARQIQLWLRTAWEECAMYIPCATQSSWCAIVCACTCTYHRLLFIKARIVHSDIRPECCGFVVMQGVLLKVLTRFDPSQRPERPTMDVGRERERRPRAWWRHEQFAIWWVRRCDGDSPQCLQEGRVCRPLCTNRGRIHCASSCRLCYFCPDVHFAPAPVNEYVASALVIDYVAPALVLSDFLEPRVPVDQVVQVPEVRIIEKTALTGQGTQTAESLELLPFVMWLLRRLWTWWRRGHLSMLNLSLRYVWGRPPKRWCDGRARPTCSRGQVCQASSTGSRGWNRCSSARRDLHSADSRGRFSASRDLRGVGFSGRVCCSSACRQIRCSSARCDLRSASHVDAVRARATEHVAQMPLDVYDATLMRILNDFHQSVQRLPDVPPLVHSASTLVGDWEHSAHELLLEEERATSSTRAAPSQPATKRAKKGNHKRWCGRSTSWQPPARDGI